MYLSRFSALSFVMLLVAGCGNVDADTKRIEMLVANIDDLGGIEIGKLNRTPAVYELIDIGMPSLPYVLPLMMSENALTRERAATVIDEVSATHFGWVSGKGWPSDEARHRHRAHWKSLGDLDWEADLASRKNSVQLWQNWLGEGGKRG